jgi:hypothetical protein
MLFLIKIFENLPQSHCPHCERPLTAHTVWNFPSGQSIKHNPAVSTLGSGEPGRFTLSVGPSWKTSVSQVQVLRTEGKLCYVFPMGQKVQECRLYNCERVLLACWGGTTPAQEGFRDRKGRLGCWISKGHFHG